jgi:RNA polymerase sigma factor (sigma-70 family)
MVRIVDEQGERPRLGPDASAVRKRAAVETYARNEAALRRTARRYSLCGDDAEDALQRGLEILLRKAPTDDPRELVKWTQTVVKHEALAVRRERERILAGPAAAAAEPDAPDWVSQIPAECDGPAERAERREAVARSREALQTLKPQELRALTLLAEGYSYAEIGEITGYSRTKINRCLAEGRERFRKLLARSEDGSRCAEMRPLISSLCDGEAGSEEAAELREHLRACAHCRSTLRAYRAAPTAAAALAPSLPLHRSLLERAQDALAALGARAGGGSAGDAALASLPAGGTRGAGFAALAKVAAVCIGTAGGAAACVATGVVPAPLGLGPGHDETPHLEREQADAPAVARTPRIDYEPAPAPVEAEPAPQPEPRHDPKPETGQSVEEPAVASAPPPASTSGAVEYSPPPAPEPAPAPAPAPSEGSGGGDPAGEFGP